MANAQGTGERNFCRKCGEDMEESAVLCTKCGTYAKSGLNVKTVQTAKAAGRVGLAIGISGAAAVLGGVVWAIIATKLNWEVGYVAWGIGILAGVAIVVVAQDQRNQMTGLAAGGFALVGLLIGKLLTAAWIMPNIADELAREKEILYSIMIEKMVREERFEPEVAQAIEDLGEGRRPSSRDLMKKVEKAIGLAKQNVDNMRFEERKAFAQEAAKAIEKEISFGTKFQSVFSLYDILWALLAVGSAFKIGGGAESG